MIIISFHEREISCLHCETIHNYAKPPLTYCAGCEGGIKIKRGQRPITHFHNISGHKSCDATSVSRMTTRHVTPEVSSAVVTFVTLCPGMRSSGDKTKLAPAIVRPGSRHGVKETELCLHCLLFPDALNSCNGQPFHPSGL